MNLIESPFCYTGSKFKLLPQIIPLLDKSRECFIDLFSGGGSVYSSVGSFYNTIIINDSIKELVEIHRLLINDSTFAERVRALCPDKTDRLGYGVLRDSFNTERKPEQLLALIMCCTNNMIRFNKSLGFNQTWGQRSWNNFTQERIAKWIDNVSAFRHNITYYATQFDEVWPEDPKNTIWYLDPPYAPKGSGNTSGYNRLWSESNEARLVSYLGKIHDSGGLLAFSNVWSPDSNKNAASVNFLIAKGFKVNEIEHNYKKVARNKNKEFLKEILITNY